jgi:hypothetical protein
VCDVLQRLGTSLWEVCAIAAERGTASQFTYDSLQTLMMICHQVRAPTVHREGGFTSARPVLPPCRSQAQCLRCFSRGLTCGWIRGMGGQIDMLYTDDTTTGEMHSEVSDAVWRVAHSVCSALVCFATLPEVAALFMVSETQLQVSDGVDSLLSPVLTLMQWLSAKCAP